MTRHLSRVPRETWWPEAAARASRRLPPGGGDERTGLRSWSRGERPCASTGRTTAASRGGGAPRDAKADPRVAHLWGTAELGEVFEGGQDQSGPDLVALAEVQAELGITRPGSPDLADVAARESLDLGLRRARRSGPSIHAGVIEALRRALLPRRRVGLLRRHGAGSDRHVDGTGHEADRRKQRTADKTAQHYNHHQTEGGGGAARVPRLARPGCGLGARGGARWSWQLAGGASFAGRRGSARVAGCLLDQPATAAEFCLLLAMITATLRGSDRRSTSSSAEIASCRGARPRGEQHHHAAQAEPGGRRAPGPCPAGQANAQVLLEHGGRARA